jgi:hypothetical protein
MDGVVGLGGEASDDVGVTSVTWTNETTGASGAAVGTTGWAVVGIGLSIGENVITVRARDAAGNTGSDVIAIAWLSQTNDPPVANAGSDRGVPLGGSIALDGSGSWDADGDVLTYRWEQLSGPRASLEGTDGAHATFVPSEPGEYVFRLTVSDGQAESSDSVIITVTDGVDTLMVIPNRVAEHLVDTVTVKGPPVLKGKRVAVYTTSGAPVGDLALDGISARGGIGFPLDAGLYILVAEAEGERFIARLVVAAP